MLSSGKLPLGGLHLNSVVRIIDRPDMISTVYSGCKATKRMTQGVNQVSFTKINEGFQSVVIILYCFSSPHSIAVTVLVY